MASSVPHDQELRGEVLDGVLNEITGVLGRFKNNCEQEFQMILDDHWANADQWQQRQDSHSADSLKACLDRTQETLASSNRIFERAKSFFDKVSACSQRLGDETRGFHEALARQLLPTFDISVGPYGLCLRSTLLCHFPLIHPDCPSRRHIRGPERRFLEITVARESETT